MSRPIVCGYEWSLTIRLQSADGTTPVVAFPIGSTWRADFRAIESGPLLARLTTDAGITVVSDDTVMLRIAGSVSAAWTNVSRVRFDFARTDTTPDQYLGLKGAAAVVRPVTEPSDGTA